MKQAALAIAAVLGRLWGLLPARLRDAFFTGMFVLESRSGDPSQGMRRLFALSDRLHMVLNERAVAQGQGEHPKHRLMRYHDFFVDRIPAGARVLDVGCGYGAVARSIARRVPGVTVLGVDLDKPRLAQAMAADNPPNLRFLEADATRNLPPGPWDVVVLSNILEHIEHRPAFLRALLAVAKPSRILIRVPLFEREWEIPMRRELGVNYFSDNTHYIEHSLDEFARETQAAGLIAVERLTLWGEIWADCRPMTA